MRRVLLIGLFVLAVVQTTLTQQPRTHELTLTPEHVHWGYYDSRVPPVLRIASGDRVRVETMVAGGLQRVRLAGVAESEIPDSLKAVELGVTERGPGAHPMTGPIFVEGAEPGDTLEVRILAIEFLHPFGVNAFSPGGGVIPEEFPYEHLPAAAVAARRRPCRVLARRVAEARAVLRIDRRRASAAGRKNLESPARLARWQSGQQGSRGGIHAVSAGARQGGLLSIGDGHGMQGDGEVTGTALETSLRGTFEVRVRKGQRIRWPRAETPSHYITMGLHEDLNEAARLATSEMIEFLVAEKGLSRDEAYVLCSLAADLHVTQAVDQTKGVHATIAKSVFK